jgi:3'-5' exoribonuclease
MSFDGMFTPHLVSGVVILDRAAQKIESPDKKTITILKHIIQSHHEKLEFGSPVPPRCIEALLVSMADLVDSKMESLSAAYENMSENTFSGLLKATNSVIYKWGKND